MVASHAGGYRVNSRLRLLRFMLCTRRSGCTAALVQPMRVGGEEWATSQLDLPSQTPLSVVSCGRLHLGVPHLDTSVDYCKYLIIDPTFCGSRFFTERLQRIEDLPLPMMHFRCVL